MDHLFFGFILLLFVNVVLFPTYIFYIMLCKLEGRGWRRRWRIRRLLLLWWRRRWSILLLWWRRRRSILLLLTRTRITILSLSNQHLSLHLQLPEYSSCFVVQSMYGSLRTQLSFAWNNLSALNNLKCRRRLRFLNLWVCLWCGTSAF